jgi:hypothetical protein
MKEPRMNAKPAEASPAAWSRSVAFDIDAACDSILARGYTTLHGLSAVRVSPEVYAAMAETRADELAHGNPLTILGLPVEPDEQVEPGRPRLR